MKEHGVAMQKIDELKQQYREEQKQKREKEEREKAKLIEATKHKWASVLGEHACVMEFFVREEKPDWSDFYVAVFQVPEHHYIMLARDGKWYRTPEDGSNTLQYDSLAHCLVDSEMERDDY